jgi:chemotaxis response regulator CheB
MSDGNCFVVGIGASAGGTEAIFEFFSHMPENSGIAFIVVRHLMRDHKTEMEGLLTRRTILPVSTARNGEIIKANHIYLMPENYKLSIQNRALYLTERPTEEIINHAIDDFFISMAHDIKEKAIGVILSGTGSDGTAGAHEIDQHGGIVMVQDPSTAQFDGMPKSAIYFDHPDYVLTLREMPSCILDHVRKSERRSK